jgi:VWFA-related protein
MERPRRTSVAALLALVVGGAPARAQETPTFPASRDLVRVDVAVTDAEGAPVTDLTQADFTVLSDGTPVAISSFETVIVQPLAYEEPEPGAFPVSAPLASSPEQNRALLIFFDDIHLTPSGSAAAQAAVQSVLGDELRPGDWVSVVSPSGVRWTARTPAELRRLPEVARVLAGTEQRATDGAFTVSKAGGMSDYQAMSIARFGRYHSDTKKTADENDAHNLPSTRIAGRVAVKRGSGEEGVPALHPEADKAVEDQEQHMLAVQRYAEAQQRIARSLDALKQAIASMAAFRGRKAAIVYSEGFIKSPDVAAYEEVVRLARQTRTTFYVIDPRKLVTGMGGLDSGLGTDQRATLASEREETGGSDYVAIATGGRAVRASDTRTLFREAATQASAYYLIGFDAPAGAAADRRLEIKTKRPKVRVHAADRYVAGDGAARAGQPTLDEAMASAFDATDVSFRVSAAAGDGSTTLGVMFDRKAADGERTLDFRVEARPLGKGTPVKDGGEITLPPADRPAMVKRTLALAPGTWQARVVARDRATGQVGSVLHTFEVPAAGAAAQ